MKNSWLKAKVFVVIAFLLQISCGDDSPGCPFCTGEMEPDEVAVPGSAEVLQLEMKWVALDNAPTIIDPSLVCEDNFKNVLMRRHIRANACVWTKQCRIVMSPVWWTAPPDYTILNDTDQSLGEEGDVVITEDLDMSDEMNDLVTAADDYWNNQSTGITAIAIRSFIWPNGGPSSVRGYASHNYGVRPYLFVVDPEFMPSQNKFEHVSSERVLAHELGHALGLCHIEEAGCNQEESQNNPDNLMLGNGNAFDRVLDANQCNIARSSFPGVFGMTANQDNLTFAIDDRNDNLSKKRKSSSDLIKIGVEQSPASGNGLKVAIGTNGLFGNEDVVYWLGFDADNNTSTGGNMNTIAAGAKQPGVDYFMKISIDQKRNTRVEFFTFAGNKFTPASLENGLAKTAIITHHNFAYSDACCTAKPASEEIEVQIPADFFTRIGLADKSSALFKKDPRVLAFSTSTSPSGATIQDYGPNEPAIIRMKR